MDLILQFFSVSSLDSYSETDAIYTWMEGLVGSVERAEDISLPQMDLVSIRAFRSKDVFARGTITLS